MREQFEKLPEIMEYLRDVEWSELTQRYIAKRVNHYYAATFINGAWYAFQEQQKRIETIFQKMDDMGMVDAVQILEDYIDY